MSRAKGWEEGFTDGIVFREAETQAVGLVGVERVAVEHLNIHLPFGKVRGGNEGYAGWEG